MNVNEKFVDGYAVVYAQLTCEEFTKLERDVNLAASMIRDTFGFKTGEICDIMLTNTTQGVDINFKARIINECTTNEEGRTEG